MVVFFDIVDNWLLPLSLWFIMFSMGLGLELNDFRKIGVHSRGFILGCFSMMVLVPLIGTFYALTLAPTPALAMGLILLATCPGGILSNLMTDLAKGNVALSMSLSLFVSFVYIFTLPFIASFALQFIFGKSAAMDIPMSDSFSKILTVTMFPVASGMIVRRFAGSIRADWIRRYVKSASTSLLVAIFLLIVVQQWSTIASSFGVVMGVVLLMNVSNLALAWGISRLSGLRRPETIALMMEHIVRQEATAIFVAVSILHRSDMSLPMIINTFMGMLVGIPAVAWLRRKAAAAAKAEAETETSMPLENQL
ncbi:bile acid:sodium symporter family protein [Altericroceibacterium endophyticum]|uniref:Bile acid:sodium symporter family protein n=1 Tax=Altericroceibacterium endophyticum TaxID=1808508 RepID=A0A6I4T236_9SPHN|nr:bile acid:sodium symporter [Altericroceibacterium endophyticum]MXO64948.1 hypothetical protein [Altericroceibacterium endophyticum]